MPRKLGVTIIPGSNLGYLATPKAIFHGCQIVHWDPLNVKRSCPQQNFGTGYKRSTKLGVLLKLRHICMPFYCGQICKSINLHIYEY